MQVKLNGCVGKIRSIAGKFNGQFVLARHRVILTEEIDVRRAAPEGHAVNARCWAGSVFNSRAQSGSAAGKVINVQMEKV